MPLFVGIESSRSLTLLLCLVTLDTDVSLGSVDDVLCGLDLNSNSLYTVGIERESEKTFHVPEHIESVFVPKQVGPVQQRVCRSGTLPVCTTSTSSFRYANVGPCLCLERPLVTVL